ncbi:uncharacterized protein [Rutidosis leptorrhynchoides]|uniref:uncharacterized protein n=1 Tax=Rutidosis leptorrhynchoides TaxID=125765 RepID=UPI003A9A31F9
MALPTENSIAQAVQRTYVYLDELQVGQDAVVKVMICRTWDTHTVYGKYLSTDFIASDEKGNVVQLTAKNTVAHCFIPRLKEGSVYLLKNFEVISNRDTYRILKDNKFLIQLQGSTFLRRQAIEGLSGFIRHPFKCIAFDALEPTEGKYLIDAVGCVLNVGSPQNPKQGTSALEFELGSTSKGHIVGKPWEFFPAEEATVTRPILHHFELRFRETKPLRGVQLYDDEEEPLAGHHYSPLKEDTLADLLALARKGKHNSADVFKCKVELMNIRMKNGWHYTTCSICQAKKGITQQFGGYWCESCAKLVPEPITRFRVQCEVRDATAETVIVFFDETAEQLTQTTAPCLMAEQDEETCTTVLPNALANLLGTTQVVLIKTGSHYEHGMFKSFNCIKVYLDEPVPEIPPTLDVTEDTIPAVAESVAESSTPLHSTSKGVKREIDVPTPPKDSERPSGRRFIVTSNSEDEHPPKIATGEDKEVQKNE